MSDKYGRHHERTISILNDPKIARNPLQDGALRNLPCLCGSGKKIKKCCGTARVVPVEFAKYITDLEASLDGSLSQSLKALAEITTEGDSHGHTNERT